MGDNLNHGLLYAMRVFVHVVDAGSFTAAAKQQSVTTAQVSRLVGSLEAHLQTKLLQRTTRKLVLTPAGERYLDQCKTILRLVSESEEDAITGASIPSGHLRVNCMESFGRRYVAQIIPEFLERYPKISIEYSTTQNVPDLIGKGIDVSIVIARDLPDSRQIIQRLGELYGVFCAAPDYLVRKGMPVHPSELPDHVCLRLMNASVPGPLQLVNNEETYVANLSGPITSDSPEVLLDATLRGIGVSMLPRFTVIDALRDGRLVRCLPEWRTSNYGVFSLIPSSEYLEAKTRAWLDLLKLRIPEALRRDYE